MHAQNSNSIYFTIDSQQRSIQAVLTSVFASASSECKTANTAQLYEQRASPLPYTAVTFPEVRLVQDYTSL